MLNLATGASPLETLLREAGGVISAVLGTIDGEVRAATAEAAPGEELAAVTAAMSRELSLAGEAMGLGGFFVVSVKGTSTTRVFARQGGAILALLVDSRHPLGELEARLRSSSWQLREAPPNGSPNGSSTGSVSGPSHARAVTPPPPPPPRNGAAKKLSDIGVVSGVLPSPPAPIAVAANGSRPVNRAIIPTPAVRAPRSPHSPLPAPLPTPPASTAPPPQSSASTPAEEVTTRQRPAVITRPRHLAAEGSTREKPSGGEAVFAGQLEEFPLADLLVFMRNGVRTGLLTCITEHGAGSIQLVRGLITGAESPSAGTLRDHLLARPELTASQRLEITVLPHEYFLDDDAIEQALLPRSLVSANELAEAREARVFAAFREMLNWTTGRFSFEPSAPPVREAAIEMSAQSVLLQIFREQDEQSR
jgi:predicted regulator of Ras-like GTPase activity (Roadblock/LC7/MglB family)